MNNLQCVVPRRALAAVESALQRQAAVALLGPRQVGYSGDDRYPLDKEVEAIGLRELASILAGGQSRK